MNRIVANDTVFYGDLYHPGGREYGERTPNYPPTILSVMGALKGEATRGGGGGVKGGGQECGSDDPYASS